MAGTIHAGDSAAAEAQTDLSRLYRCRRPHPGHRVRRRPERPHLLPGVHHTAAAFALTGTLTLDGDGDPNAVFIFQVDAALNTAAASHITLIDGATASHVFWQVSGRRRHRRQLHLLRHHPGRRRHHPRREHRAHRPRLSYGVVTLAGNTIRFTTAPPPSVTIDGGPTLVTKDTTPTITGTTSAVTRDHGHGHRHQQRPDTGTSQVLTTVAENDGAWHVTAAVLTAGSYPGRRLRPGRGREPGRRHPDVDRGDQTPTPSTSPRPAPTPCSPVTGVANVGLTTLAGDLGVSTINTIVGFPPGTLAGTIHNGNTAATQAQADRLAAYTDANARTPHTEFTGDLNGRTFHAGVHHTAAALALTGTVVLDGEDDPDAVFIFQVDAALNTAAASQVILINGATAANVYWQVEGAAGTGANSIFAGNILAAGAITLGDGTQLTGTALTLASVTLATNAIEFTTALPPAITITGGASALTKDSTPTIAGTSNAPTGGSTVTATIAGQTLTASVLAGGAWNGDGGGAGGPGTYPVVASVRDAAGNAGTASQALTVEVNPDPVEPEDDGPLLVARWRARGSPTPASAAPWPAT